MVKTMYYTVHKSQHVGTSTLNIIRKTVEVWCLYNIDFLVFCSNLCSFSLFTCRGLNLKHNQSKWCLLMVSRIVKPLSKTKSFPEWDLFFPPFLLILQAFHELNELLIILTCNRSTVPKSTLFTSVPMGTFRWLCPVDKCDYFASRAALLHTNSQIKKIIIKSPCIHAIRHSLCMPVTLWKQITSVAAHYKYGLFNYCTAAVKQKDLFSNQMQSHI